MAAFFYALFNSRFCINGYGNPFLGHLTNTTAVYESPFFYFYYHQSHHRH